MRRVAAGAGLLLGAMVTAVVLWPSRRVGPEPIAWGREACAECRMHLSQPGFAGELRAGDGTLTKYDDVGCLLRAMLKAHDAMAEAWVEDHDGGGFVPLPAAHLVRAGAAGTPMGYGLVAFRDEAAAQAFGAARDGEVVRLEDVVREPSRLARAAHAEEQR